MDTINNYIETMFKEFPNTNDVVTMKKNISDAMEDKYNELIKEGKSENEAIGTVISQFGNIDELRQELSIPKETTKESLEPDAYNVSMEEVEQYLRFKKKFAFAIAIGVACCIISLLFPALLDTDNLMFSNLFTDKFMSAGGIFGMFTTIAIGVFLFIIYGMKNASYEDFERQSIVLKNSDKAIIVERYQKFQPRYTLALASGVILCILAVAITGMISAFVDKDGILAVSFFTPIAFGVFLIIYYGIIYGSYRFFIKNEEYQEYHKDIKQSATDDSIFAITMPLAVVLYLIIGFCYGLWHPGWLIFPVFAILTSIFVAIKKISN